MRITYALAILLLSSPALVAQTHTHQAPVPPQAPPLKKTVGWSPSCRCDYAEPGSTLRCTCGQECPCVPPLAYKAAPKAMPMDTGWTDAGNGYQRHSSGYWYHPSHGVYYPQSIAQPIPFYSRSIPFYSGGFAGGCPPSG